MTTPPGIKDFVIYQGATWLHTITWKSGDDQLPVDLTGYTARLQARGKVENAATFLDLTTENGGIALSGAEGIIVLEIGAADTANIVQSGVYDLELQAADGVVTRLLMGNLTLSKEVTR